MSLLADTIAKRRADWDRLEHLLGLVGSGGLHKRPSSQVVELSELYRRACADLAMAEQYQLSPSMVEYLHTLVGRAHNTLYASRRFQFGMWFDLAFRVAPREIYRDTCIQVTSLLFFGLFALSAYLSYDQDRFGLFAEKVLGPDATQKLQNDFTQEMGRSSDRSMMAAAFYIQHNTGIGLQCFALGPLILPGLFATIFNAVQLGSTFGYMARADVDGGDNFMNFVTAHGAFELTAIALAAGIGLRIGIRGWLFTVACRAPPRCSARGAEQSR